MDSTEAAGKRSFATRNRRIGAVSDVKAGDTLAGWFLIRETLGIGATGTVFSALDNVVGQKVALKLLHPELDDERALERLRREVRSARAAHPNLVTVYDLHQSNGRVFLSMELVEGRSLKDLLHDRQRLEPGEVAVVGPPPPEGRGRAPSSPSNYVTILDDRGSVVSSTVIQDLIGKWEFP